VHEAGLLAAAIADALAAAGPDTAPAAGASSGHGGPSGSGASSGPAADGARRPVAVVIRVHDPVHIGVDAARMHAELALRARGLGDVPIEVTADPVACPMCDVENEVHPDHPFCEACGWPLPDRGGHQVEATVRWATA
jgi:hypothetical protein